jgi:phospholipid transport system substrate-binding protein
VGTTLTVKKDQVSVDYKLYKSAKGGWRIYDVVTDEVSLVETYQSQFRKLLADKGFDGLLSTLKSKRAQLEKSSAGTKAPAAAPKAPAQGPTGKKATPATGTKVAVRK